MKIKAAVPSPFYLAYGQMIGTLRGLHVLLTRLERVCAAFELM